MQTGLRIAKLLFASALAFLLPACGGDDTVRSDEGVARFYYTPFFRDGRLLTLVTFEGGLVYGFYQSDFRAPTYPDYAYAGFFAAQLSPAHVGPPSRVGTEYRFDEKEVASVVQAADQVF